MTSRQNGEKTAGLGREEKEFSSASKIILYGRVLEVLGNIHPVHMAPGKEVKCPRLLVGRTSFAY